MKKQDILNITNGHYRKLKKHADEITRGYNAEAIHRFRVEYKKLRAFLRMLSYKNSAGEIKLSKELKKAYSVSGTVRDLQLQQRRVLQATRQAPKRPRPYLNLLQREIDALQPELIEIFSHNPVAESKKKTTALLPGTFPLSSFRNFVQRKWAAIYAILAAGHFSDDNIHTIRKVFKDLFYNLHQYKGVELRVLSASVFKRKDEFYFDELITELGVFQDRCISISLLRSYWLNSLNSYNSELLGRLKKEWIKDKLVLKQALINKMRTGLIPYRKKAK